MRKSQKNLFALPVRDLAHVLDHTPELAQLRGKSLFMTGGTGFFGKWLLGALCHANEELDLSLRVTILSRNPARFQQEHPAVGKVPSFHWIEGDVADVAIDSSGYDYILHAATDTTAFTAATDEAARAQTITHGTGRILDLARANDARLLYISSGAVYGAAAARSSGAREDDFDTAEPQTPYGRAKRDAEKLCGESGIDFSTARAFAFLGPHLPLDAHFAAGNFLRDARRGGPIQVRGDGTALRSYLHPADLVVWLLRILLRGESGRAYNVGSDEVVSTAELARLIAAALDPAPHVLIQSVQPQGPQNIYLPDIARARSELNLDIDIPLRDAIARTLAFLEGAPPATIS